MSDPDTRWFPSPPDGKHGWPWTRDDGRTSLVPLQHDPNRPGVSIITPSFNQGRFLEEAIRSVLLQDHPNIECIVIDGGSTDQSADIIERYEPWISFWVSEPDHGQADAINKGFDHATGDYLCWLNSDDVLYQGFLSRRVDEFSARPQTDLIYGDVHSGWDDGERCDFRGESLSFPDMLRTLKVSIPQQSAMWRRSAVDQLGGLNPRWHVVLDREFFLRIAHHGSIEYIPGVVGYFRQHGRAKSVAETTAWVAELPLMYAEFFADDGLEPEFKQLECETTAAAHLRCADILRGSHDWSGFLAHLAKAIRWSPGYAMTSFIAARAGGLRRRLSTLTDKDQR